MLSVWNECSNWEESVFESVSTAIITTDNNATVRSINRAAGLMFEVSREQAIGASFFDGLAAFERSRLVGTFEYVMRTGKTYIGKETPLITRNSRPIIILPRISQLKNLEGTVIGMVMLAEDVSEKHYLEQHLQRSEKLAALGLLAAGVAHEVRNPLGTIKGFASIIRRSLEDGDNRINFLDVIVKETDRLSRVTQELLDFARQERPQFKPVQLNKIIEKSVFLLGMNSSLNKVEVFTRLNHNLPEIMGDEEHLLQSILNLLQNAVDATGCKGQIIISTRSGDWVEVIIQDDGSGIPKEDLTRIFDPFYSTREKGTGLGLSIVHQIVSKHGGHIRVESQPGVGTAFTLRFPPKERMNLFE